MAGGVGYVHAKKMLAKLLGGTDFTPETTWYAALMTTAPTDAGGGVEVSGGSYARVAVANNTTNFPAPGATPEIDTGADIDWGTATANWGTIVAIAFYDASSGGNLGPWGPISVPTLINSGSSFKVTSGNGAFFQA